MLFETIFFKFIRTSLKEKMALQFRQLAVLTAAGIPVAEAIETLKQECSSHKVRRVLSEMQDRMAAAGSKPETVFESTPYSNPGLLYLLKTSTNSEELASFLNKIADELETAALISTKIKTSMVHPLLTLSMVVFCCFILLIFVIPVFQEMFSGFGASLPGPTQFVINLSRFIRQNLIYLSGVFLFIVLLMFNAKQWIIPIVSRMPLLNRLLQKKAILQFVRYFSMMAAFEVPKRKAFYYASLSVENPYFSKKLLHMADGMTEQKDLKTILAETGLFSKLICQVAYAGEKSKSLHTVFRHIATFYEKELNRSMNSYVNVFDALFLVLTGTIVGGLVIAMYMPIFSMAGAI